MIFTIVSVYTSEFMNKSAFTFLELLLVIILTLGIYSIYFTNFNFKSVKSKSEITLSNLKESLLEKYEFQNTLKITCIKGTHKCYVIIDDDTSKKTILSGLFKSDPEVYTYDKDMDKIDFEYFNNNEVSFEYSINKYRAGDELIVVSEGKVYLFTAILKKPLLYESLTKLRELREDRIGEVKDAF